MSEATKEPQQSNVIVYISAIGVVFVSGLFAFEKMVATSSEELLALVTDKRGEMKELLDKTWSAGMALSADEKLEASLANWQTGGENAELVSSARKRVEEVLGESEDLLGLARHDEDGRLLFRAGQRFPPDLFPPPVELEEVESAFDGPFRNNGGQFVLMLVPVRNESDEWAGTDVVMASMEPVKKLVQETKGSRGVEKLILGEWREGVPEIFFEVHGEEKIVLVDSNVGLALSKCDEGLSGVIWPSEANGETDTVAYVPLGDPSWGVIIRAPGTAYPPPSSLSIFTSPYFWAGILLAGAMVWWAIREGAKAG